MLISLKLSFLEPRKYTSGFTSAINFTVVFFPLLTWIKQQNSRWRKIGYNCLKRIQFPSQLFKWLWSGCNVSARLNRQHLSVDRSSSLSSDETTVNRLLLPTLLVSAAINFLAVLFSTAILGYKIGWWSQNIAYTKGFARFVSINCYLNS